MKVFRVTTKKVAMVDALDRKAYANVGLLSNNRPNASNGCVSEDPSYVSMSCPLLLSFFLVIALCALREGK